NAQCPSTPIGLRERGQPLAKRPITDLIVILQEIDESGRRQMPAWLAALASAAGAGRPPLVGKAFPQAAHEMTRLAVIPVVALPFAGQKNMPDVVIVVIPLCAIATGSRLFVRREQVCAVVVIFKDEVDVPAPYLREFSDRAAQLDEDIGFAASGDCVHGIETKPVEAIRAQPMQRFSNPKGAPLRHAIVDGAAPRRLCIAEKLRRAAPEVVSLRPEVIVDGIKKYHQAARVRSVDQRLEVLRPPVPG